MESLIWIGARHLERDIDSVPCVLLMERIDVNNRCYYYDDNHYRKV